MTQQNALPDRPWFQKSQNVFDERFENSGLKLATIHRRWGEF